MFIVGREVSKQMFTIVRICCLGNKIAASRASDGRIFVYMLKSDMVAVLAVSPRYPRYYRGNGYNFYGITAVLGPKYAGFPWGWGPALRYYRGYGVEFFSRI